MHDQNMSEMKRTIFKLKMNGHVLDSSQVYFYFYIFVALFPKVVFIYKCLLYTLASNENCVGFQVNQMRWEGQQLIDA